MKALRSTIVARQLAVCGPARDTDGSCLACVGVWSSNSVMDWFRHFEPTFTYEKVLENSDWEHRRTRQAQRDAESLAGQLGRDWRDSLVQRG